MRDASVSPGASAVPPALLAGLTVRLPLDVASASAPREASQNDPFLGRTLDGKYRIEQRIGRGGSGTVYRARHMLIHRTVAIKVLSPELISDEDALARFRREAAMAGRLRHFNIVSVTDFGITPDGVPYLVMDFIEGKSLRRILDAQGTIAPEKLLGWLKPICSAIHAAHRKGIIHRDLKPDNVMIEVVDGEEIPRVLDFGIAKLMDAVAVSHDFTTETGSVMGTPHYMSPEQCEGKPLDARSDIYSLGVLVYELLTGNVPFPGKVTTTVMMQQVTAAPRPLRDLRPELPEAVELCVMRALSKNPAARQATALDFALEFEAALAPPTALEPSTCHALSPASQPCSEKPLASLDFRHQLRQAAAVAPAVSLWQPKPPSEAPAALPAELPLPAESDDSADSSAVCALEQNSSTEQLVPLPQTVSKLPATEETPAALLGLQETDPSQPNAAAPVAEPVDESAETPRAPVFSRAVVSHRKLSKPPTGIFSRESAAHGQLLSEQPRQERGQSLFWPWLKAAGTLVGLVVVAYALLMYLLYRQANLRLTTELEALVRQPPLTTLRERTAAHLAAQKLVVEGIRVRLDPPNQRVTLRVRYRRNWLGLLPLHFEAEVQAQPVAMTLDMVANLSPAQAEVVNVSPRELERRRREQQTTKRQEGTNMY
jgi:serine/threonine-protein kinase